MDGVWKDEPAVVKEEVRRFFARRFQEDVFDRPTLDGISFKTINSLQNDMLVERFKEEEIDGNNDVIKCCCCSNTH